MTTGQILGNGNAAMRAAAVGVLGIVALLCVAPLERVSIAELLTVLADTSRLGGSPYLAGGLALGGVGAAVSAMWAVAVEGVLSDAPARATSCGRDVAKRFRSVALRERLETCRAPVQVVLEAD